MDELFSAVRDGDVTRVREIFVTLAVPADWFEHCDEFGETVLQAAAAAGSEEVLRFLLTAVDDKSIIERVYGRVRARAGCCLNAPARA